MNVFDYVNEILQGKKNLMIEDGNEKDYNAYIVNRALAQHQDCVELANMMNERPHLDNKMQFLFLLNSIRSKKRPFNKWAKAEKIDDIEEIKTYYNCSTSKAIEYLRILSEEEIIKIKRLVDVGGLKS